MFLNCKIIILCLTLLLVSNAFALSSDKDQPIVLEADSADINEGKGISIYQGKVTLTQGSTHLQADKLTVYHDLNHNVTKIETSGSPAHYQQTPDNNKTKIKASSQKMVYYVNKELIHLYEKAYLWQGKNSFSGEKIVYDKKNNIVQAFSKRSADGEIESSGRVKVTIQPNSIKK